MVNNDNSEEFDQKIIEIQKNNPTLPYLVASTWKNKDSEKMWVIFKLESKTEDQVIKKIIEEINDGIKQFTGNSSSIICCHIPEIDSFSGLENSSAVKNATNQLFDEKKLEYLWGIIYFSDYQIKKMVNSHFQSFYPMISLANSTSKCNFEGQREVSCGKMGTSPTTK
ncbi:MAG: hypothetical protein Q8N39_10185, partial [Pelolinea sp.]|nr:hypothetical protein [Pelolinea sp.]